MALIVDSKRRPRLVEVDAALKKEIHNGLGDLIDPRLRDMILNNVDQHSSDETVSWNELELDWREGMRARVVHVGTQWIVLTFDRKSLNQWNGFTGKQIGTTIHVNSDAEQGDRSHIAVADLSPDGKTVAVGLTDGNVQFWDAATGRKNSHEMHHEGAINDLAFTDDSKMLAVACNRTIDTPFAEDVKTEFFGNYSPATVKAKAAGCVRLWNLETGELDFWDWQSTPITYVSVSPNPAGTYLIYAGTHVESWNRLTRRPFDLSGATFGNRDWLLFQAALAGFDRVEDATAGLLNATTAETQDILRQFLAEHLANQEWTVAVGIRDNDGLLFSLDSSGTVRLWGLPVRSQKQQTEYAHRAGILSVAFGPESDSFATGCDNGCVYLWNTNDSERPYKRLVLQEVADGDPKAGISHVRYSRDGSRIIVQDDTLRTQVWNLETGQAVKLPAGETLITVANDGSTGLVATSKDEVIVKNLDTNTEQCRVAVRGGARPFPDEAIDRRELMRVQRVTFSDDGKMLAMINADGDVEVFSTADGKAPAKPLTHEASGSRHLIRAVQFSPDGSRLLTQSRDVRAIWMTSSFQLENFYRDPTGVQMSRFSLDGRFVLTATNYNMARIWNVPKHRVDGDALLHGSRLWGVCSDQKGEFIATGSADRTARVWDAVTGLPVSPPR